jgi:hypothetical protein
MKGLNKRSVALAGSILLLALLYFAVSRDVFRGPNWLADQTGGRYILLSKAFLEGRTWLQEASLGLISYFDLSAYDGRFYMYFGAVPALTLYLPVYLLTFKAVELTDKAAVLIFSVGALAVFACILADLRRRYFPRAGSWLVIATLAILAVCDGSTVLLSHVRVYEVAIAGGLFYLMLALLLILKALERGRGESRPLELALISSALILAVGCRPTLFIIASALLAILIWRLFRQQELQGGKIASLLLPFAVGLAALAAYNYARFGSPFEFGWHYQITVIDQSNLSVFDPQRLLTGLRFNLLQFPERVQGFPFFHVQNTGWQDLPAVYYLEYPLGLFAAAPFSLFALLFVPLLFLREGRFAVPSAARPVAAIIFCLGAISLLYLSAAPAVVDRYRVEFACFFLLAASMSWMHVDQALAGKSVPRAAVASVAVVLGLTGCYINLFVCTWFT